jgi:hypothetical protein
MEEALAAAIDGWKQKTSVHDGDRVKFRQRTHVRACSMARGEARLPADAVGSGHQPPPPATDDPFVSWQRSKQRQQRTAQHGYADMCRLELDRRRTERRLAELAHARHQLAWEMFAEAIASKPQRPVRFTDIPWPHDGSSVCGLVEGESPDSRRAKLRAAALRWHPDRWHPDKFAQIFGARLAVPDEPAIFSRVTEMAARVNEERDVAAAVT